MAYHRRLGELEARLRKSGSAIPRLLSERVDPGVPIHVIFSPSKRWGLKQIFTLAGYRTMCNVARDMMRLAGVVAGVIQFHAYRTTDEGKALYAQALEDGDEYAEDGIWTFLRHYRLLTSDNIYLSPHFHVVGYGYMLHASKFKAEQLRLHPRRSKKWGLWFYKNKGPLYTEIDIKKCLNYLLSHAAIVGEKVVTSKMDSEGNERFRSHYPTKSVSYCGELTTRNLKTSAEKEIIDCLCDECMTPVYRFRGFRGVEACDIRSRSLIHVLVPIDDEYVKFEATDEVLKHRIEKRYYYLQQYKGFVDPVVRVRGVDGGSGGRSTVQCGKNDDIDIMFTEEERKIADALREDTDDYYDRLFRNRRLTVLNQLWDIKGDNHV